MTARLTACIVVLAILGLTATGIGQTPDARAQRPGSGPSAGSPDPAMPRPIDALDSVFIEELTWLEVRDALRAGKTTAIVATGGVEMNGPYLATGKHNYVLRATTEAIARQLGDALVAPIVPFVPEGQIAPPTGMMRYPGTISVRAETFDALLTDIASSLKTHGFEHIVFLADSGGNVDGMKRVAARLAGEWAGRPTIHYVPEYYDYPGLTRWLESQGIREVDEGHHDDYGISAIMMTVDPATVRMPQRMKAGRFSINGVPLAPAEKTIAMGRRAVDYRATITVEAIRKLRSK
jgi:creatinine amidohydrolase/Fe(II)-dependent formamide hydrolase-like protein